MKALKGIATGIGSLPFAEDAEKALELVFKYVPQGPFWPQLPKRDVREGMVAQFSGNLPCLKLGREGVFFDTSEKDRELEDFYARIIGKDVEHFAITPDYAIGLHKFRQRLRSTGCLNVEFIKCHITGPFTFAAAIKDESGKALLHDKVFLQAVIKGLLMKALWQIKYLSEFGKRIVVFIDEPYLGCFGSAYTPLNREEVITGLTELTEAIKAEGALTGVHCCGNTDWSIFTDTKTIDIINFDAYSFLDKFVLYAKDIDGFLKRGGVICWGIVPTQELDAKIKPAELLSRLNGGIDALVMKGVGRKLISENLLVSPACGLGTLEPRQAEKILSLLSEVSSALRNS